MMNFSNEELFGSKGYEIRFHDETGCTVTELDVTCKKVCDGCLVQKQGIVDDEDWD